MTSWICELVTKSHQLVHIPGVPKHMKRFESLITFDSTKIGCSYFLLRDVLYIEIIKCQISTRFHFMKMQDLAFKKGFSFSGLHSFYFHG